jgi:hypothetical protein
MTLFFNSRYKTSNATELISAVLCSKTAGYFLLKLYHTAIAFGKIIIKGDIKFMHESQNFVMMFFQSVPKIEIRRLCFSPSFAGNCGFLRFGIFLVSPINWFFVSVCTRKFRVTFTKIVICRVPVSVTSMLWACS